ncbi:hypothetical protein R1flu_016266 [Riccia fluitans]|uniref:Uncharacterized protein n=1 Tax=Riccia fluitans TaxID=41844 RepID=A0ABD1YLK3_9MARC
MRMSGGEMLKHATSEQRKRKEGVETNQRTCVDSTKPGVLSGRKRRNEDEKYQNRQLDPSNIDVQNGNNEEVDARGRRKRAKSNEAARKPPCGQ